MKRALAVTWFAVRALYDELFLMSAMGFIWFVVALALPYGVFYLVSLTGNVGLTIAAAAISLIPLPPITGALYSVAIHIAREKRIEFGYFWEGFKTHFWQSWKVGLIALLGLGILVIDVFFYLGSDNMVFKVVGVVVLWALLFWALIQVYLMPLSLIQEDPRLRTMLRNAGLLTLAFPLYGVTLLVITALVTALSIVLVVLLVTVWIPFVAILFCRATISSVREAEAIQKSQDEVQEEMQDSDE